MDADINVVIRPQSRTYLYLCMLWVTYLMSHMAIKTGLKWVSPIPYPTCALFWLGLRDTSSKNEFLTGLFHFIIMSRHEFDSENVPDLTKDVYMQDIHCVGSLCKLYFRELPNPLLTYQLYDKFAVSLLLFSDLVSRTSFTCTSLDFWASS